MSTTTAERTGAAGVAAAAPRVATSQSTIPTGGTVLPQLTVAAATDGAFAVRALID